MKTIAIDLYADIACPWCYLGEAQLAAALAARPEVTVTVRWQPFQLQPQLPPEGVAWRRFAEHKFGGWERALAAFEEVSRAGREAGLTFDFTGIQKVNNTADAHRLVLLAQTKGLGAAAAHELFRAYFGAGRDLNDPDVLLEVAEAVGLERGETRRYLESEENRDAVAASQLGAAELGIRGVPFYVLNSTYGVSGAQPAGAWLEIFEHLPEEEMGEGVNV